ncbi:hypothetical protein GGR53DRAFT_497099 [Hypoxylon sp. FL1150]|nr:hypothetical protein GGR53DRAFT_497099 [Hypoxylon sp. FL1150]
MKPATDPLKRFEGAIGVIVQVKAGVASPIWGPLHSTRKKEYAKVAISGDRRRRSSKAFKCRYICRYHVMMYWPPNNFNPSIILTI